jgi:HicA toxin of bacterial toxin-antitoxin,
MNAKHRRTLAAIFANPVPGGIRWHDIEALFTGLGAKVQEREGSRVSVVLRDIPAVYHRPHPQPETRKVVVRAVREHLVAAGYGPEEEP